MKIFENNIWKDLTRTTLWIKGEKVKWLKCDLCKIMQKYLIKLNVWRDNNF